MDKILRILFCLAVFAFLQARSFSLREKVPRNFPRPLLQEMIPRANQYKRAGHFFNWRDESECEDLNQDCQFVINYYNTEGEGSYDYCREEENQAYVKMYCRETCGFCTKESKPKPPAPEVIEEPCQDDDDCSELVRIYTCKHMYVSYRCGKSCNEICKYRQKHE